MARWSRLRVVLVALVGVAALGAAGATSEWWPEDVDWFDAAAVPVTAERAREMLCDVNRWDAATSGERRGVAERVAAKLDGFTLVRVREYGFEGHRHEIAVFLHAATGMEFSLVPGGAFDMGSPADEAERDPEEGPRHRVTIAKPFLVSRTETTQAVYERMMGMNPSEFTGPDRPVETVSWDDAAAFCAKAGLRLPTEAEWEYACRAGTRTRFWSGDREADLARVEWYAGIRYATPSRLRRLREWIGQKSLATDGHHPVAQKPANPYGLHDVHGNVQEWCEDVWHATYDDAPDDGSARAMSAEWGLETRSAAGRVIRGGNCDNTARYARAASRDPFHPSQQYHFLGFRPVKSVAP